MMMNTVKNWTRRAVMTLMLAVITMVTAVAQTPKYSLEYIGSGTGVIFVKG